MEAPVVAPVVLGHSDADDDTAIDRSRVDAVLNNTEHSKSSSPSHAGQMEAFKNDNVRILCTAILLFGSLTIAQFFASIVAHSDALLVDCASMTVDTLTYCGNLAAEWWPNWASSGCAALIASGFSLFVLYVTTAWGLADALFVLYGDDADDALDPWIVLGFGIGGVILDCLVMVSFHRWGFGLASVKGVMKLNGKTKVDDAPSVTDLGDMNMCTALGHVLADLIRSVTTVVMALIVIIGDSHGARADGWATLIISITILCGSSGAILAWCKQTLDYTKSYLNYPRVLEDEPIDQEHVDGEVDRVQKQETI